MSKLRYFTETNINSNTGIFLPVVHNFDKIVIGANCVHVFRLPFSEANDKEYLSQIEKIECIYKQGTTMLAILLQPENLIHDDISYVAEVNLTAEQTSLFKSDSLLDLVCQLKITLLDGTILYNRLNKVRAITPIDKGGN